jgi:hypothetical protein
MTAPLRTIRKGGWFHDAEIQRTGKVVRHGPAGTVARLYEPREIRIHGELKAVVKMRKPELYADTWEVEPGR